MCRTLLTLGDAFTNTRIVYEDLGVPEITLRTGSENWIWTCLRILVESENPWFLLLKGVHQGHWFMLVRKMQVFLVVNDALVTYRSICFVFKRLHLGISVLKTQLGLRLSITCQLNELVQLYIFSLMWIDCIGFQLWVLSILNIHHVVEACAFGSWEWFISVRSLIDLDLLDTWLMRI